MKLISSFLTQKQIPVWQYPVHWLDLVPVDCFLFLEIRLCSKEKHFEDIEAIRTGTTNELKIFEESFRTSFLSLTISTLLLFTFSWNVNGTIHTKWIRMKIVIIIKHKNKFFIFLLFFNKKRYENFTSIL